MATKKVRKLVVLDAAANHEPGQPLPEDAAERAASGSGYQGEPVPEPAVKISKATQKIINSVESIQDYVGKELSSPEEVEQAISHIVEVEAAKFAKPTRQYPLARASNKRAAKSEVVKSKADTIDADEPKTIAGKPQILDETKVKEIIRLSDQGKTPSELAKQFGVAPSHISNIIRGVTWVKVTGRHYVKGAFKRATKQVEKPAPVAKATIVKSKDGQPKTGKGVPPSKGTSTKKGGK